MVGSHGSCFLLFQPLREDDGQEAEGVFFQFLPERLCQAQLHILLLLFLVLGPVEQRGAGGGAEDTVTHLSHS